MNEHHVTKADNVNKPKHYEMNGMSTLDYILAFKLDFLGGNVIKYVSRYKYKHDKPYKQVEDLKKARFYLDRLIEKEEALNPSSMETLKETLEEKGEEDQCH